MTTTLASLLSKPPSSTTAQPTRTLSRTKRSQRETLERAHELELEALLFGTLQRSKTPNDMTTSTHISTKKRIKSLKNVAETDHGDPDDEALLFQIDRQGISHDNDEDKDDKESSLPDTNTFITTAEAAWKDDDDDNDNVDLCVTSRTRKLRQNKSETTISTQDYQDRLRQRFVASSSAHVDWARVTNDDNETTRTTTKRKVYGDEQEDDQEEDARMILSSSSAHLLQTKSKSLAPNLIQMIRCRDVNLNSRHASVVQSVHFHPSSNSESPLLLTAGLDKLLQFYQVSSDESTKIHTIQCECCDESLCRSVLRVNIGV
jgi:hypothetical protein